MTAAFDFLGVTGRPPGLLARVGSVLPGVRAVQAQVRPYAEAWREHNREAVAQSGPLWVALGDSMTLGVGASAYDRGWVGQLAATLGRFRVINLAQYGARVSDALNVQLPVMHELGAEPDLVTLLIGSNDQFSRGGKDAVVDDYGRLLARVPVGTVVANLPQGSGLAARTNPLVARAAARRGLRLADTHRDGPTSWRGRLAADRFHPNDLGYAGISEIFRRAIEG